MGASVESLLPSMEALVSEITSVMPDVEVGAVLEVVPNLTKSW
jgi:hypothetical protein